MFTYATSMLDPATAGGCYLYGVTTEVKVIRAMKSYNIRDFRMRLKKACSNCKYIIKAINEALGTMSSDGFHRALTYSDRGIVPNRHSTKTFENVPTSVNCDRPGCKNLASRRFECPHCTIIWYCSAECGAKDWNTHGSSCGGRRFRRCALVTCRQPASKICGGCYKVPNRIPAVYCTPQHQTADWENHKSWCRDYRNLGPPPGFL